MTTRFEIFLSTVFLIGGVALTILPLYELHKYREATRLIVGPISVGENFYSILRGKDCFGKFKINFENDVEFKKIEVSGFLRAKYQQTLVEPQLNMEFAFNSLGQMGGSLGHIKFPPYSVKLGSTGVSQIKTVMELTSELGTVTFEKSAVGPILLKKNEDNWWVVVPQIQRLLPVKSGDVNSKLDFGINVIQQEIKVCDGVFDTAQFVSAIPIL